MKNVNCPYCGVLVQNEDRLAGQVIVCPNCRNPFQLPPPGEDAHFAFGAEAAADPATGLPGPARAGLKPSEYGFRGSHLLTAAWVGIVVLCIIAVAAAVVLLR